MAEDRAVSVGVMNDDTADSVSRHKCRTRRAAIQNLEELVSFVSWGFRTEWNVLLCLPRLVIGIGFAVEQCL